MSSGDLSDPEPRNQDPPFRDIRHAIGVRRATTIPAALVVLLLEEFDRLRSLAAQQAEALRQKPEPPERLDGYDTEVLANAINGILSTSPENQAAIVRSIGAFFRDAQ